MKSLTICAAAKINFGDEAKDAYRVFHGALLKAETDMAYLLTPTEKAKRNQQYWIPKSLTKKHGSRVKIPDWLWNKTIGSNTAYDWLGAKVLMADSNASKFYKF